MAEDIGALVVRIETKLDNFNKGFQSAQKKINGFAKGIVKVGTIIGAGTAAAGVAILGMATKASDVLDRVDKLSQKIGLSKKGFQEWDFIMSQSGASIESLQMGFKTLTGRVQEVIDGTGDGAELFKQLGISVRDSSGAVKNQEQLFNEIVKAFQGMENGSIKAALANDLLGRSGSELMPLLNGTAGSVEELRKKANDLGIVLSDEAIDAGVKFTDAMDLLKRSMKGLMVNIITPLIPKFTELFNHLTSKIPDMKDFANNAIDTISNSIKYLNENVLPLVIDGFKKMGNGVKFLKDHANILIPVITGLTAAIIAQNIINGITKLYQAWSIATKAQTTLQWLLNAVLSANPFGLVAIAIGVLIAAGVALWKNWDTVKAKAIEIFGKIKNFVAPIIDGIKESFKGMVNGVVGALNFMIRALNKLKFTVPDWVPAIGGKGFGFNIPEIPKFAKGTNFVPFDTAAFIHKGEAVIPANNNPSNPNAKNPIGNTINNIFNLEGLIVKNENDIKLIAKELYNLQKSRNRTSFV